MSQFLDKRWTLALHKIPTDKENMGMCVIPSIQ